jgi:hypothetical protein
VLLWPHIVSQIKESGPTTGASDLRSLLELGSPWLLHSQTATRLKTLSCNVGLARSTLHSGTSIFPDLTVGQVQKYSVAYFNTFNVLLPLLDLESFMTEIVARLLRDGLKDNDPESVLALLVFALGQLAVGGVVEPPASMSNGKPSGFRGGKIEEPPGLGLFNEARRRTGLVNTQCRLVNAQIMLLQATYFEASGQHLDFWSSTSAASLACMCLIKGQHIDWTSRYGDFVKRAYWACALQERLFDLEFRVTSTGIESLEDQVPLPHFHREVQLKGQSGGFASDYTKITTEDKHSDPAFYFVALITLSRLIRRVDDALYRYEPHADVIEPIWRESGVRYYDDTFGSAPTFDHHGDPPSILVQELICQLDNWRDALPRGLQWSDRDRVDFEEIEPLTKALQTVSFTPLHDTGPGKLDHNVDIAIAQLRTRFYHARFLICLPFVYKALHMPGRMTADDRTKCAFAIDAACLWPLSLAPPKNKKHLVPHLFSWTQSFLTMSLVLRMCRTSVYLDDICKDNGISRENIESSISSMITWLEDVKQVDGIADWGRRVLGSVPST